MATIHQVSPELHLPARRLPSHGGRLGRAGQLLWKHRLGVLGILLTALPILLALFAPFVTSYDPNVIDLPARFTPPVWAANGTMAHPLGTDQLGRDTLTRLAYGARISLFVGLASVLLGGVVGVALGLLAGYRGGVVDQALMTLIDIQLSIPYIALAMAMVAIVGAGTSNVVVTLSVVSWVLYARVVRAETLHLKQCEYVEAARACGASPWRILLRHVLPNIMPQVIIIATFSVATMITLEAALSFLGLGIPPPTATWGRMLADTRGYIANDLWQPALPGLALMATLLGINLLGDWLRDLWDPRLRGRKRTS